MTALGCSIQETIDGCSIRDVRGGSGCVNTQGHELGHCGIDAILAKIGEYDSVILAHDLRGREAHATGPAGDDYCVHAFFSSQ
jgi:hypothetical protein